MSFLSVCCMALNFTFLVALFFVLALTLGFLSPSPSLAPIPTSSSSLSYGGMGIASVDASKKSSGEGFDVSSGKCPAGGQWSTVRYIGQSCQKRTGWIFGDESVKSYCGRAYSPVIDRIRDGILSGEISDACLVNEGSNFVYSYDCNYGRNFIGACIYPAAGCECVVRYCACVEN